jgi:hypothetical protein
MSRDYCKPQLASSNHVIVDRGLPAVMPGDIVSTGNSVAPFLGLCFDLSKLAFYLFIYLFIYIYFIYLFG